MHWLGLTGGIASGKSLVSAMLAKLGVPIIDADILAREVVRPNSPALDAIIARFGPGMRQLDGTLDRKKLGQLVFRDAQARRALNAILHPRIHDLAQQRMWQISTQHRHPYAIYSVPLLYENQLQALFQSIIVVYVDPTTQRHRLMHRDALSLEQANQRIQAQLPLEQKSQQAHWVVDNRHNRMCTLAQVQNLYSAVSIR